MMPDFVADDDPLVVSAFGGLWVPPYYAQGEDDGAMARVLAAATEFAETGRSDSRSFSGQGRFPAFDGVLRTIRKWLGVVLCVRM